MLWSYVYHWTIKNGKETDRRKEKYLPQKPLGHKIPVPVSDCLMKTGIPVRFYPDILKFLTAERSGITF